ncbi:MAG: hypothetical protein A2Y07_00415 [Planctomycetes bacterium GWF2_50_10]|nr:MAG: hypothetical protein A2Y07_00415 [Planctomycetes bacterium GWF2_50_10]
MNNKLALGINIGSDQITLAMLKKTRKGITLVKAASSPTSESVISAGNIKNPAQLARMIKDLCSKHKLNTSNVILSLVARPSLLRVTDMPRDVGGNVKQFVKDELKHYAPFAGKTVGHDFAILKNAKANRLLLGAADEDKIAGIVKACNRIGVIIRGIEPASLAAVRAIYAKHIAKKFDSNILVAHVQDNSLTCFVFRDGLLDFIKATTISSPVNPDTIQAFTDEIVSVKQYYQLELNQNAKNWEFFITDINSAQNSDAVIKSLQAHLPQNRVYPCLPQNVQADTSMICSNMSADPAAAGLAMRLFDLGPAELKLNLLPASTDDAHNLQKFGLVMANVAAAAFLAVLFAVPVLKSKLQIVQDATAKQLKASDLPPMEKLLTTQNQHTSRAKYLKDQLTVLTSLSMAQLEIDYAQILREVQHRIPRNVQITKMTTQPENFTMTLSGLAATYEEVNMFTKLMARSPVARSASLIKTEVDPTGTGLLSYNMLINLAPMENDPNAR